MAMAIKLFIIVLKERERKKATCLLTHKSHIELPNGAALR